MAVIPARGRLEDVRAANRALLLALARELRTTPRRTLARRSGLSRAAAYEIADELQQAGVLAGAGVGTSSGGRRPQLLRFEPQSWLAIGIELGERDLHAVVTDLDGTVLLRDQGMAANMGPGQVVEAATASVARLKAALPDRRFLGVGFASPGRVDMETGCVHAAVGYDWFEVPLAELLRERTGMPAYVASRSKAAALGEFYRGAGVGARHLVYLYVGRGIASGIIIDGNLYTGASSSAGEVGHVTVLPDGALCDCGSHGCLHTLASGAALLARAQAELDARPLEGRLLRQRCEGDPSRLTTLDLAQAARAGDSVAVPLVRDAGRYLGIAAGNLLDVLNPDHLIFGGPLTEAGPAVMDPFLNEIRRRAGWGAFSATKICLSALQGDAGSIGAATLVVRQAPALIGEALNHR